MSLYYTTAIIIVKIKNAKTLLICADRQESGNLIDYNNISTKHITQIGDKRYYPIELAERPIGINQTEKIFQIRGRYIFVGSGKSEYLNEIKYFTEFNYKSRALFEDIKNIKCIKDIQFVIIDIRNIVIHYFNKGDYSIYADEILIFGDVDETQPQEDILYQCIERYSSSEVMFDQIIFVLHELSKKNHYRSIASPFCSGCNLFRIKNKAVNSYKAVNYFRWEND